MMDNTTEKIEKVIVITNLGTRREIVVDESRNDGVVVAEFDGSNSTSLSGIYKPLHAIMLINALCNVLAKDITQKNNIHAEPNDILMTIAMMQDSGKVDKIFNDMFGGKK